MHLGKVESAPRKELDGTTSSIKEGNGAASAVPNLSSGVSTLSPAAAAEAAEPIAASTEATEVTPRGFFSRLGSLAGNVFSIPARVLTFVYNSFTTPALPGDLAAARAIYREFIRNHPEAANPTPPVDSPNIPPVNDLAAARELWRATQQQDKNLGGR